MTTPRIARRTLALACAALAAVTMAAACSDDSNADTADTAADTAATADTAAAPDTAPSISIDGAWARTSPKMATAGAVYLTITNDGDVDDALLSAAVDSSVAGTTEVHETVVAETDDTAMTDTTMGEGSMGGTETTAMPGEAMMTMQPIDRLAVPAGGTVALEPGGYHIMLLDLVAPLEMGSTVEVTLEFEVAGQQVVTATVGDAAP